MFKSGSQISSWVMPRIFSSISRIISEVKPLVFHLQVSAFHVLPHPRMT